MDIQLSKSRSNSLGQRIGIFLFCIYIVIGYLANDIVLPTIINTIFLYLFIGYSVIYTFIEGTYKISKFTAWQIIFTAISIFSLTYSPLKEVFEGQFYLCIVNLVMIYFLSRYEIDKEIFVRIAWSYAVGSALLIALLIRSGNVFDSSGRLGTDLVGNANILAAMLMVSAIYAFWLLVYTKNSLWKKIILIGCVVLIYYGMFLSGGRKYIFIPLIFLYIILFFKTDNKGRKHLIRNTVIVAALLVLVIYIIMNVPSLYDVIGQRLENLIYFIETGRILREGGAEELRAKMIEIGWNAWPESPLLGHGFDSFKYYNVQITGRFFYSHNNFIELLYNLGIAGFIVYYWFYIKMIITGWRERNSKPQYATYFSIALFISMLFYETGAINYSATSSFILFYLSFALLNKQYPKLN